MKEYNYFPVVESKTKTKCTFCGMRSDYRTFLQGRIALKNGDILHIKMCRNCFSKAKYNISFLKKIINEVKSYIGI